MTLAWLRKKTFQKEPNGIKERQLYVLSINVSSVVEFQRWWVLKSKLFAQESTCSKEILTSTSSLIEIIRSQLTKLVC